MDFQPPELRENKFLLFMPPCLCNFVMAGPADNTLLHADFYGLYTVKIIGSQISFIVSCSL